MINMTGCILFLAIVGIVSLTVQLFHFVDWLEHPTKNRRRKVSIR